MKKQFRLHRLFIPMCILGCSLGFTACNDDDNPSVILPPDETTTNAVFGDYTGKMLMADLPESGSFASAYEGEEIPEGTDITANVKQDTVYFDNFPIKDIVLSVVGDEETANKIVEAIGTVKYQIGYAPTLTEAKDSIFLKLDPKPLKLSFTDPDTETAIQLEVNVAPVDGANYEVSSTNLKFNFNIPEIQTGEGEEQAPLPGFTPKTFSFNMNKGQNEPN